MKLSLALLSATFLSANALKATSSFGTTVLSQARRVEENEDQELAWLTDYSLKFQGCHHVYQWNEDADEDEDVRLYTKRLIRFRMCPSDTCSLTDAGGCSSGYGDYVVDMQTYVGNYYESSQRALEEECNNYEENVCGCDDGDDDGNAYCLVNCFKDAGLYDCIDLMENEENEDQFDVEEYLECAQIEIPEAEEDDNEERRKLEDGDEEEEVQYYVGPYCSGQGGSIHLGMFTDDTCTTFASSSNGGADLFEELMGYELPYADTSIVSEECFSCTEANYDDDDAAAVEVSEVCEIVYETAGKCEYELPSGTVSSKENSACTYIEGIKVIREDGLVLVKPTHANAIATAFTVIFAVAFAAVGFYVWYLRTRLGIKTDSFL